MTKYLNAAIKAVADVYEMCGYLNTQDGKDFYAKLVFSSIHQALNKLIICLLVSRNVKFNNDDLRSNIIALRESGYNSDVFNAITNEYVNIAAGSIYSIESFSTEPCIQRELLYVKRLCLSFAIEVINELEPSRDCPNINLMEFI